MLQPYPYQCEGIEALTRRSAYWLADEQGLGKTCQVIRAAERTPHQRNLVVCPAIVRRVWVDEIKKWSLLDPFVREIKSGRDATYLEITGPGWWIVSYAYARRYWRRFVGLVDRVVLDEVHALKNLWAKQTIELLGPGGLAHARGIKSVWALTGTPSPNHPGELYPVGATIGGLPPDATSYRAFVDRYCVSDHDGNPLELRRGAPADRLKASLSKVMLRRTKGSVGLQLPPLQKTEVWIDGQDPTLEEIAESQLCRFTPEELRAAVEEQRATAMQALEWARGDILTAGISTLRVWVAMRKRRGVLRLIEDEHRARLYDRLVIFGLHRDMLQWLVHRLPDSMAPALVDGQVSPGRRAWIFDEWRAGRVRTIVGQIHAMGTGLTLTEANQVLVVEPWWNEDINNQALARLHRISQSNPVNARYVMCGDEPFESGLMTLLKRKEAYNVGLMKDLTTSVDSQQLLT